MKYKEFHLRDWRGGYNSLSTPEAVPDNSMVSGSLNADLYIDGAVRTRKGYTKVLTDADATTHAETSDGVSETLGVHQFIDPSNVRCLVRIARATADSDTGPGTVFSSGDVCIEYNTSNLPDTISGSGWTLALSGGAAITLGNTGTANQYCDFVSYSGRLYIACPGLSGIKYLTYSSGFTVNSVTDSSSGTNGVNKPKGIEEWYGRIWSYMDESVDDGSYLYWTDLDGSTVSADNYVLIPGDGPITGIARVNRNLLVFKGGETFILSGGDDPVANLRVETVSREFGCIARRSVVQVEGGVYWMSRRGFFFFDGSTFTDVSRNIKPEFDSIAISQVEKIHGVHNKESDTVNWFVPYAYASGSGYGVEPYGDDYGGGGYFFRALSYDFSSGSWCAPFSNQDFVASCTYVNSTSTSTEAEEIVIACRTGDYDNHVMQWYTGNDDDGTEITATVVTKPLDLGDPGLHKIVRKVYSQVGETGTATVKIDLYDNYDTIDTTTDTPQSSVSRLTSEGSDESPKYLQKRHTVGLNGKHVTMVISMNGPAILSGLVCLYSTKGRRS